jgi:uncharacterized protein (DUF302 family)
MATRLPAATAAARIERSVIATGLTYPALIEAFERELGRWDPAIGTLLIQRGASWSEVERDVERLAGPHGLMIFCRVDQGVLVSLAGTARQCSLYLVGNPIIAQRILSVDVRACLYVPFRVSIYDDGGPEGACIAYDWPSSFLAALGRAELTELGALLDRKMEEVVAAVEITARERSRQ